MAVFRIFSAANIVACFDEPNTTGNKLDINAPRNAPAKSPHLHLDKVYFHSDFDYLGVAVGPTNVTINHAGVSAGSIPPNASIAFGWNSAATNHLLVNHGLGYVPQAMVVYDDNLLWPGMPVQVGSSGGSRFVSFGVTSSQVRLYEYASIGASSLPAASRTYTVLVFHRTFQPTTAPGFRFTDATGVVGMAKDKILSTRRYLQSVAGGTPFGIAMGRTIDLNNGAPRAFRPDGTSYSPVPSTLRLGLTRYPGWPTVYGASMAYAGSASAPPRIQVQAP